MFMLSLVYENSFIQSSPLSYGQETNNLSSTHLPLASHKLLDVSISSEE